MGGRERSAPDVAGNVRRALAATRPSRPERTREIRLAACVAKLQHHVAIDFESERFFAGILR